MNSFLSCDWGTSSFRLRLVEVPSLALTAEVENDKGSAETFKIWQQSGKPEEERVAFYRQIITEAVRELETQSGQALSRHIIVISGMASSTIGMMNLPYKEVPVLLDGYDLNIKRLEPDTDFPNPILIISGIRTEDDVMRGEETKLIGCDFAGHDEFLILPGTHPKHVFIEENKISGFKTYMTGEFFKLLSKQSILATSVEAGGEFETEANRQNFEKGVRAGSAGNILRESFLVRTNNLFAKNSKQENFYYLSGLLIGNELKEVKRETNGGVILLGGDNLSQFYQTSLSLLNIPVLKIVDADDALVKGQSLVYSRFNIK